jgi:hypothetical protein
VKKRFRQADAALDLTFVIALPRMMRELRISRCLAIERRCDE